MLLPRNRLRGQESLPGRKANQSSCSKTLPRQQPFGTVFWVVGHIKRVIER
jgi:hypothetical protein